MTFEMYYCNEGPRGKFRRVPDGAVATYDSLEHAILSTKHYNPSHTVLALSATEFIEIRPSDGMTMKFVAINS